MMTPDQILNINACYDLFSFLNQLDTRNGQSWHAIYVYSRNNFKSGKLKCT